MPLIRGESRATSLGHGDHLIALPMDEGGAATAVDHRGRPIIHSTTGGWRSSFFIIGVEISERFAYYGIASNLITYMTGPLGKSTASAAAKVNAWSGTASMLPLLGGLLADSYLGRYRTILVASVLYLVGLGMLVLSAVLPLLSPPKCNNTPAETKKGCGPTGFQAAFFFVAVYFVALAQGCHKPCAQAFAADQFDDNYPDESKSKSSFFNWWYCAMCVGTTAALLIVNYVQDNISWGLGFGIPWIAMVIALVLFLLGTRTYRYYLVTGKSSFAKISHAFLALGTGRKISRSRQGNAVQIEDSVVGSREQPVQFTTDQSRVADVSQCLPPVEQVKKVDTNNTNPAEAKEILMLFPIWATCLIYAVIFSQTTTLFTKQGSTMDGKIGRNFKVPPAALQTFISFTIVLFIPIYDRILVPVVRSITGIRSGITILQRIGTGQFLSVVSMSIAALVETKRLKAARDSGLVDFPKATIPMSLWWLVPQYVVFGIADVFTIIGMQEFFYEQVPDRLRSFGLALYLSVLGAGSFLSSILITVIDKASGRSGQSWFSNNLNRAHIDYFYWLLAMLSGLELGLFLYFARSYQYRWKGNMVI